MQQKRVELRGTERCLDPFSYLVTHAPKRRARYTFKPRIQERIVKVVMDVLGSSGDNGSGENGASLLRSSTHGHDVVKGCVEILVERLRVREAMSMPSSPLTSIAHECTSVGSLPALYAS